MWFYYPKESKPLEFTFFHCLCVAFAFRHLLKCPFINDLNGFFLQLVTIVRHSDYKFLCQNTYSAHEVDNKVRYSVLLLPIIYYIVYFFLCVHLLCEFTYLDVCYRPAAKMQLQFYLPLTNTQPVRIFQSSFLKWTCGRLLDSLLP